MISSTILLVISTLLAFISPIVYSYAILKGKAKPHRTTRVVLLLITALATASLFAQGDRVAIWLAGVSTFQSLIIFILSIKHGMGGWSKTDILCLLIAGVGILLWKTTDEPVLALYFSLLADFTGMVPALIKTYKYPQTEVWSFYLLDVFAAIFNIAAIQKGAINEYLYPIYIMLINLVMVVLIIRPKQNTKHNRLLNKVNYKDTK